MSLIMDATKAAQREKARRDGEFTERVPVLVPLRAGRKRTISWRMTMGIAIGGAVVLSAGVLVFRETRDTVPRALALGPSVSTIVTPADRSKQLPPTQSPVDVKEVKAPVVEKRAASSPKPPVTNSPSRRSRPATVASSQLRIAVEDPRLPETARVFAAAVEAHRAGNLTAAQSGYQRVLAVVPNDPDALNNLGVLYSAQRDFVSAEVFLRRAISASPSNAGAWNNLGTVLRERGRSGEAIAAFQRALALDPGHVGARVSLAQQFVSVGSYAQARQLLEAVLAANPGLPEATYALGQTLEQLGDRPGAVRAYQSFVDTAPASLAPYVDNVRRRIDALTAR